MANAVVTVKEADGVTETDVTVLDVGRQAAAASKSLTLSTEDKAVLDSLATKLDTAITALQIIDNMVLAAGTNNIGDVDVLTVPADPFGANADAASATGSLSAKLRGIATALGVTALDLGSGTGGSRTLRTMLDTTQVASVLDCATSITRPNDTNAYTANDAFANSTSAPTAGGFTFSNAASASGGGGRIDAAVIVASGATLYEGEIWVYDSAISAVPNDNAAFTSADADQLLLIGIIPFTLAAKVAANSVAYVTGLAMPYHCVGTANLRFTVRITNAPTPAAQEVLTVRLLGVRS